MPSKSRLSLLGLSDKGDRLCNSRGKVTVQISTCTLQSNCWTDWWVQRSELVRARYAIIILIPLGLSDKSCHFGDVISEEHQPSSIIHLSSSGNHMIATMYRDLDSHNIMCSNLHFKRSLSISSIRLEKNNRLYCFLMKYLSVTNLLHTHCN